MTKDYETVRISIAFHPVEERFEVANPAIRKDVAWIEDVADVFAPQASLVELTDGYTAKNVRADRGRVSLVLEKLRKIVNNSVGVIDLAEDLAASEKYGGNLLRKAIDYFCHLAVAPEFLSRIEQGDTAFAKSEFLPRMRWLSDVNDDIYDPTYTDMLRVAFTSESGRGRLQDLVALLSGRNFETKEYEEAIAEASFARLKKGILAFVNKTHFDRITMILRSAGFVSSALIGGLNAVNFAYIIYLRGRAEKMPAADLERLVRRWYVMATLRRRYTGNPETESSCFLNGLRHAQISRPARTGTSPAVRRAPAEVALLRADRALVEPARQQRPGDPRRRQRRHLLVLGRQPRGGAAG